MNARRLGTRMRIVLGLTALAIVVAAGLAMATRAGAVPDVPTADVTRGDFVDYIQIRGQIRPVRSIVLSAPMQAGELLITTLVKNGTAVKKGDVLVEFDATTLKQRLEEKRSELKQAEGEIAQTEAQERITDEQNATAVAAARYDLERAKLDLGKRDIISRIEFEQSKLAVNDAGEKVKEAQAKAASDHAGAEADKAGKVRKRQKALFDVQRAEVALAALQLRAPADGTVNIMPNYRSGGPFGGEVEFREGDRAWAGANIVELPDLSSIHLEARLDEQDRGRLQVGQPATIRIEAVPGREFHAKVDLISVLARVDFSSGWPPARNFELGLVLEDPDPRVRPGMSATARIASDRVPNMLLAPAETLFQHDGHPVVYRLHGSLFDEQRVEVAQRGREQIAVASGVEVGDRLATRRPDRDQIRGVR